MRHGYRTMPTTSSIDRRGFVRAAAVGAAAVGGLVLGVPASGEEKPAATETNIGDFLKVPRTRLSLPGLFPGRVVKVTDARVLRDERVDAKVAAEMVEKGIRTLTGKRMKDSFSPLLLAATTWSGSRSTRSGRRSSTRSPRRWRRSSPGSPRAGSRRRTSSSGTASSTC